MHDTVIPGTEAVFGLTQPAERDEGNPRQVGTDCGDREIGSCPRNVIGPHPHHTSS